MSDTSVPRHERRWTRGEPQTIVECPECGHAIRVVEAAGERDRELERLREALEVCRNVMNGLYGTVDQPNRPTNREIMDAQEMARAALASGPPGGEGE